MIADVATAPEDGFRRLDDLILDLKGLVLAHRYREERGAEPDELAVYRTEIDRVRARIASLVKHGGLERTAA